MRIMQFAGVLGLMAGLSALPVMAAVPATRSCSAGKATPASYTWNFRAETQQTLQRMQNDAAQAKKEAAQLQAFALDPFVDWQVHATDLMTIKQDVNDISRRLCRLEEIRRVDPRWQQRAIDSTARLMPLLADNTTDAVNFLNANQQKLWEPAYRKYVANLYSESQDLYRSLGRYEEYAKAHTQELHLGKKLGMKAAG